MTKKKEAVLVTGGSAGIGKSICEHFIQTGANVINLDINPALQSEAHNYHYFKVDLADPSMTRSVADHVRSSFHIACLVNNAGNPRPGNLEEVNDEDFDASVNLQLRAPILLAQSFVPAMEKRGSGRIINITSRAVLGKKARTLYSSTKAGLVALTRTWAVELGHKGITVNAISPGPVLTELFKKNNPAHIAEKLISSTVVGRAGHPDDIARAVLFFADERNSYITGQVLHVCGGSTLGSASS